MQTRVPEELIPCVADADGLLVQWATINRKVIEAMTRCKVISRYGIGVDMVDLQAAGEHGIPVANVPDFCIEEVSMRRSASYRAQPRTAPGQVRAFGRLGIRGPCPAGPLPACAARRWASLGWATSGAWWRARPAAWAELPGCDPYVDRRRPRRWAWNWSRWTTCCAVRLCHPALPLVEETQDSSAPTTGADEAERVPDQYGAGPGGRPVRAVRGARQPADRGRRAGRARAGAARPATRCSSWTTSSSPPTLECCKRGRDPAAS